MALVHFNPALGNVDSNVVTLTTLVQQALDGGAKIVATPELSTTGFSISREEVLAGLGLTEPYPQLSAIRDLAVAYQAYVFVGIAEVTLTGAVYNSVLFFGPQGFLGEQQKRTVDDWHDNGTLPFDVIPTPYGDIGALICSNSYLPDWLRILTIKGADIVLLPANWWGRWGQEEIWQTRARENGVWFFTANRWGTEVDTRWGYPYTYEMNDAPSTAITPDGDIKLLFRSEEQPVPHDTVLYFDIDVPEYRIGTALNPVYSVNFRKPSAYQAIGNAYYRRDLTYVPAPGLPTAGITRVASMGYVPSLNPNANLAAIQQLWAGRTDAADVVVLPGGGVSPIPILSWNPSWRTTGPWATLQQFVNENGISLMVTTATELSSSGLHESLVLLRAGAPATLVGAIHDSLAGLGSGAAPYMIDLPAARVGVLTGRDALFPETGAALAKSGADIIVISSSVGAQVPSLGVDGPNYFWNVDALGRMWRTRTNEVVHLAAADATGTGIVVENGGGWINQMVTVNAAAPLGALPLDANLVRYKYLNPYWDFDFTTLLGW